MHPKRERKRAVAGQPAWQEWISRQEGNDPAAIHDAVAKLAYSYWQARGGQGGSAAEDWLRAERELRPIAVKA